MGLEERVRRFCSRHRLRLNRKLGQHFLVDEAVLDSIVEASELGPDDHAVEIGPGIGVLTERLLAHAGRVTAIELDGRLIPLLRDFIASHDASPTAAPLEIIQGNALKVPFPQDRYAIVANIPYHITSPLLRHAFLESPLPPRSLTLLIQREVAEKICDERHRGMLTILVGLFGVPRIIRHVGPNAFLPPPEVYSSILHVQCFKQPQVDSATMNGIFLLTKIGFGQKRKMLRNTVGQLDRGMERLEKAGIAPERRPEALSVREWIALARAFHEG